MIIERLDPACHDRSGFDCGESTLNQFLQTYARQFYERNLGVTWVAVFPEDPKRIVGYYTLSMHAVLPCELENPHLRLPRIPVVLLGRLAIDRQFQRQGYGERLLMHALFAAYHLSTQIGAHAVVVDPLDARAILFYEKFDFTPMPGAPERLYLSMKHLAKSLGILARTATPARRPAESSRIPTTE